LKKHKKIEKMIDLLKILVKTNKNWNLTIKSGIFNKQHKTYYNILLNKIKEEKLENNITFVITTINISEINVKDDIYNLLDNQDIYINTSDTEAFGYAIAESCLYGITPFILQWNKGGSENIWPDNNYLTIDEIAKKMEEFSKMNYYERNAICNLTKENLFKNNLYNYKCLFDKIIL